MCYHPAYHLHARYQHCFGAARLERPLAAQCIPSWGGGHAGPACASDDAKQHGLILATLHCHLNPFLGRQPPSHAGPQGLTPHAALEKHGNQTVPDLSRQPIPLPLHSTRPPHLALMLLPPSSWRSFPEVPRPWGRSASWDGNSFCLGTSVGTRQSDGSGKRQAGDKDKRGPGNTVGLVPALANTGVLAARLGFLCAKTPEPARCSPAHGTTCETAQAPSALEWHSTISPSSPRPWPGQVGDGGEEPSTSGVSRVWGCLCHPSADHSERQEPRGPSACLLPARAGTDQVLLHGRCSRLGLKSQVPSRACSPPPASPAQLCTSHFPAKGAGVADFYQTQTTGSPQGPSSPSWLPHLLDPALQSTQVGSQQPEDICLFLLLSPLPGHAPSTQQQCFSCLPQAALALTAAGPQVTTQAGDLGFLQGALPRSPHAQ